MAEFKQEVAFVDLEHALAIAQALVKTKRAKKLVADAVKSGRTIRMLMTPKKQGDE